MNRITIRIIPNKEITISLSTDNETSNTNWKTVYHMRSMQDISKDNLEMWK